MKTSLIADSEVARFLRKPSKGHIASISELNSAATVYVATSILSLDHENLDVKKDRKFQHLLLFTTVVYEDESENSAIGLIL